MGGGKKRVAGRTGRRGRPKKLKTLEEVKADIDRRNPTYVSPVTGGLCLRQDLKNLKIEKKMR